MARQTKGRSRAASRTREKGDGDRVDLPDGRWYYIAVDDPGKPLPLSSQWIWETGEDGRNVSWQSQKRTADLLSITTRWLQDLGDRGLPSRGHRGTREYPWPDVLTWYSTYKAYEAIGKRVRFLSMAVARAEDQLFRARVFGEEMAES